MGNVLTCVCFSCLPKEPGWRNWQTQRTQNRIQTLFYLLYLIDFQLFLDIIASSQISYTCLTHFGFLSRFTEAIRGRTIRYPRRQGPYLQTPEFQSVAMLDLSSRKESQTAPPKRKACPKRRKSPRIGICNCGENSATAKSKPRRSFAKPTRNTCASMT